ncbi:hypothetical protein QBC32DRAFT_38957 [Pseudoneurospora amorphoporcata]|uniref:NECAP PHear domain-containing protein n=1 Tax=Pseudoneurospora amorphoporcata TaxID=241081 RepID=A0AAN6SJM5_9PEZI|nr:hypothetical protein QBC32DRAFT_38957 [Pseudoneurospora amorphoporcata]
MTTLMDPATQAPLPADAIQRILHITNSSVHIYQIPPMRSTKGHMAADWTADPKAHIFTGRVRIIETSIPPQTPEKMQEKDTVKVDIVLEDPATNDLIAAAPYTTQAVVEAAIDSSRFFALRVQDPNTGKKAMLGIGFEERSEAFDFGVALQEAQKSLGLIEGVAPLIKSTKKHEAEEKKDYSLKDGETITVNLSGTKFGRRSRQDRPLSTDLGSDPQPPLSAFSLPPPPSSSAGGGFGGGAAFLPPPPSSGRGGHRRQPSAQELGFDDGPNGMFE